MARDKTFECIAKTADRKKTDLFWAKVTINLLHKSPRVQKYLVRMCEMTFF